jgi:hypothetical protein
VYEREVPEVDVLVQDTIVVAVVSALFDISNWIGVAYPGAL